MTQTPPPQEPYPSVFRKILSAIAVLLLLAALLSLYTFPADPTPDFPRAIVLILAGTGLFLAAKIVRTSSAENLLSSRIRLPQRAVWIAAAVVLSIVTTVMMLAFQKFQRENYIPVMSVWFGSMVCYLVAFRPAPPSREEIRTWWREHWKECLAVGSVVALAAALRFYKLGEIPRVINGDEGWVGNFALSTTKPPLANPFALWENFGAVYLQAINWAFIFLGINTFSLRLVPAVAGTLAVPALYLFGRQIAGKRIAFFAAFLLAISHTHLNYSRTVAVGYIQDTWLVPLELYLLLSGLRKKSYFRAAAAGVLMGFHFSIYLTPQIFIGMLLVFSFLVLRFFRRRLENAGGILATFWAGLAVTIPPETFYALTHTNEFFDRLNADGTFQSGWLTLQMAATGKGAVEILAGRVAHAFLTLITFPSIDFYGSWISVLSLFSGVFFLVGLVLTLWRTRSLENLLLNGYFWVGPLAIGLFAVPETADSYRILMILPAAVLMAGIGLNAILEAIGVDSQKSRLVYASLVAFILVNLFAFNYWAYFVDHAGKCRYGGDSQTRFASYLGKYLATLQPMDAVYLLSDEVYRYGTHPSVDFLSRGKIISNIPDAIDSIDPVAGEILIASPDRIEELLAWAHAHPGGKFEAFYDCQTLFVLVYHVP
jgi:4-amino-4-deoxy-L-arabinose transferase-like glycosyltransferase/uncharacterized membrane protein YidH (DUF202 family)